MPRSKATPIQNLEAKAANAKETTTARKPYKVGSELAPEVQLYSTEKTKPEQLTPILCFQVLFKQLETGKKSFKLDINGSLHNISPYLLGGGSAGCKTDTVGLSGGTVVCSKDRSFLSFFDPKNLLLLSECFKSQLISLSVNVAKMKLFVNFCDKCLIFGLQNAFDVLPPVSRKLQKQTSEFIDLLRSDILSTPRRPPAFNDRLISSKANRELFPTSTITSSTGKRRKRKIFSSYQPHGKFTAQTLNALAENATADKRLGGSKRHKVAASSHPQYSKYQPPDLLAKLRPYQLDAVKFAIDRESLPEYQVDHFYGMERIPCLSESSEIYYCKFNGALVCSSNYIENEMPTYSLNGGILADEMGLGKTIETISLILLHPRINFSTNSQSDAVNVQSRRIIPKMAWQIRNSITYNTDNSFGCICSENPKGLQAGATDLCSSCGTQVHVACMGGQDIWQRSNRQCLWCISKCNNTVPARGTLIVCPNAIVSQWEQEIYKHVVSGKLNVCVYKGIQAQEEYYHPLHFEDYDIVLTTYQVLRNELSHTDIKRRTSKFKKRYIAKPSPLTSIQWWRICMDEAQMVESSTAKAAEMALKLTAINKWAISGTPFVKGSGLADLYGLLLFLKVHPWGLCRAWFRHAVQAPIENSTQDSERAKTFLGNLLSQFMWRSSKSDVQEEINVPPQSDITYRLKFSATERHFYELQKNECKSVAAKILDKMKDASEQIDERSIEKIATPLLRLRQACCHPQVGTFGITPLQAKTPIPMSKILSILIDKAKDDCNKKLKDQVLYMSGLAAIANIQNDTLGAIRKYSQILQLLDDEAEMYKIDKLQRLHCLHNLANTAENILRTHPNIREKELALYKNIQSIKSESKLLRQQESALQANRVAHINMQLQNSTKYILDNEKNAHEIRKSQFNSTIQFRTNTPWYQRALDSVYASSTLKASFIASFRAILANSNPEEIIAWQAPRSSIGMGQVIGAKLDTLMDARANILGYLHRHTNTPTDEEVRQRGNCKRCSSQFNRTGSVCFHCHAEDDLYKYNRMIFSYRGISASRGSNSKGDNTSESMSINDASFRQESILCKVLRKLGKMVKRDIALKEEVKINLHTIDHLKQECVLAHKLHTAISQRLAYLDELDTCTMCMRLRLPGEDVSEDDSKWIIFEHEVPIYREKDELELVIATTALNKAKSNLRYLLNVQQEEQGNMAVVSSAAASGKRVNPVQVVASSGQEAGENGCSICLGTSNHKDRVIMACAHIYCFSCMKRLIGSRVTGSIKCSVCRQTTDIQNIENIDDSTEEKNQSIVAIGNDDKTGTMVHHQGKRDITVVGSFGTKIENVVICALKIMQDDPENKFIVFSQWEDVLDIAEKAFNENNISNVRLGSGKKLTPSLNKFKHDPFVNALLLPIKKGANGLNLIEATHVILLDSIVSKAVESQAIGRIHRIGQSKETMVHRFIVEDTIEEKIDALQKSKRERGSTSRKIRNSKTDARLTGEELRILFEC